MFRNYFKIALRNLSRRKGFAFVNLLGLTVGVSTVALIGLYLNYEYRFDQNTPAADRIYRLMNDYRDQRYANMAFPNYNSSEGRAQRTLVRYLADLDGVETAAHFVPSESDIGGRDNYYVAIGERRFVADNVLYTNTPAVLTDIFPQQFLMGNAASAFAKQNSIVITEKLAKRWFGDNYLYQDILNQPLTIRDEVYQLTGVIADVAGNIHYDFDWVVYQSQIPSWGAYTYVKLAPNTAIQTIIADLNRNVDQIYPSYSEDELAKGIVAVPLTDLHFTKGNLYELKPAANRAYLRTFALIGLIILLIVLTNYTNLSVAMYADRQRELGVRKTLGARAADVYQQIVAEAVVLSILSLPICLLLVAVATPFFNQIMAIQLAPTAIFSGLNIILLLTLLLLTGVIAASYPALTYGNRNVLKLFGKQLNFSPTSRYFNFRNALFTLQFVLVISLLSITLFMYQQMNYIQNKDLGYQSEDVIYFGIDGAEKYELLKNKLAQIPQIEAIGANGLPGAEMYNQLTYKMLGQDKTFADGTQQYLTNGSVEALNIDCPACAKFAEGKEKIFVINQTAADKLAAANSLENPVDLVGKTFVSEPEYANEEFGMGIHYTIDGIIPDYDYFSLKYAAQPMFIEITNKPQWAYEMIIRADTDDWSGLLAQIETAYSEVEKVRPLELKFLDERLQQLYAVDYRSNTLLTILSLIVVVLAMLGLAAMVAYLAVSRQREMSIRKILGAQPWQIITNFNRNFVLLTAVATLFAAPIAFYFAQQWLDNFAYQIELSIAVILIASFAALLLIITLVSWQSWKVAQRQPAEVLRSE